MAAVYDGKSERSINNGLDRIDAPPVYEVPFVYPLSVHVRMKFERISYTVDTGGLVPPPNYLPLNFSRPRDLVRPV